MKNSDNQDSLDCKGFVELIHLIADDEASELQKNLFRAHEEKCGHCAEYYNIEQSMIDVVRNKLRKECCPEGFANSVREKVLNS
ncbi:MAG: anti-sigma factor (TIGR02949 family) [Arenicella sp.]|jgi:anti-sigma factor (TIGR02949 family)